MSDNRKDQQPSTEENSRPQESSAQDQTANSDQSATSAEATPTYDNSSDDDSEGTVIMESGLGIDE